MDVVQNYKCPCCTAPLVVDAETQLCKTRKYEYIGFKRFVPLFKDYKNRKTERKFWGTYIIFRQNPRWTWRKFLGGI